MDLQVHVTLYNAEHLVVPCVKAALKVYPSLIVHDFGSEDDGPYKLEKLGVNMEYHGRIGGDEYSVLKNNWAKKSRYTFWIDADEIWPEDSLKAVQKHLETYSVVNGYWKNLKVRESRLWMCEPMHRGAIAWDTTKFYLHRGWPWEKLDSVNPEVKREDVQIDAQDVWCYHGVLLNMSNLPDKKNRWKKRAHRDDESKNKNWEEVDDFQFEYEPEILEKPKFVWYK